MHAGRDYHVKKFESENDVKRALQIQSFSELSENQFNQLAEMLPNMSKEVATVIMGQISAFADFGKTAVSSYMQICNSFLEKNTESQNTAAQGYQKILDGLSKRLNAENITESDRKAITRDMIDVGDKIAELDKQNKEFLSGAIKTVVGGLATVVALTAGALGAKNFLKRQSDDHYKTLM